MRFCSVMARGWKTTFKIVVGILSLLATVFILSLPVDAGTHQKTAVIRASDGHVYEVQYTLPLRIENFSIQGLDGDIPSREIAAELYIAAFILNRPSTEADIYSGNELWRLVHEECLHTAKWKGYHKIATMVGSKSMNLLVGLATGSIEIMKVSIEAITGEAIKAIVEETVEAIIEETIKALAEELALQVLEEMNLFVREERVLLEACIVTQSYVERAIRKKWIFEQLVVSAEDGREVSIADIKGAYNALLQADLYVKYVHWMLDEYIVLPDRWERLWTFAKTIFPPTAIGQFFAAAGKNIEDLRNLQRVFAESDSRVATEVSADVAAMFSQASKSKHIWNLTSAGFFDRKPPTIEQSIEDMQLLVSVGARLFDLATIFNDPNGDELEYSVEMTDTNIADVEVIRFRPDGELLFRPFLEITPKSIGTTEVTIEARDPTGLSADETFTVTVDPEPAPNQPPRAVNRIPAQSLTMGSASSPLDVSVYFHDPDGGTIFYTAASSNPAVATTQRTGSEITILPQGIGTATITITAENSDGVSATQTFTVTVTAAPTQTQPPEPVGTIQHQNLSLNGGSETVDVGAYFSSESSLIYRVSAEPSGIVDAQVSGSRVTIRPLQAGGASVVITACNQENPDLCAIQTIPVSISHAIIVRPPSDPTFTPPSTTDPAVEGLREGVSVITQQLTAGVTLAVRPHPNTQNIPEERIGNGVTGTIKDGPRSGEGFRWWYIDWDIPGLDLKGWSVEADRGQILFRRPPDLEIRSLAIDDDEVDPGERFEIEIRVRNNGPGESARTEVSLYYSPNRHRTLEELAEDGDLRIAGRGTLAIPSLREGRSSDVLSLWVEAPMTPDRYYYGALLPSNIHDTDYTGDLDADAIRNNLAREERVEVMSSPDLIVESISADKSTVDPGESFQLDAIVRNQGIGEPEDNAMLRYYQSSNVNISSSDTEVGNDSVYRRALDTNGTEDESISLTAPNEPGVYYYGACVDRVENESNTRNNCSGPVAITVRDPAPDPTPAFANLVPGVPTVSANALAPGQSFTLETRVENRGTGDSGDTTLRWYRSSTPNVSTNDTEVGSSRISLLSAAEIETVRIRLNAPIVAGTYYYGACVENVINESNTVNNCSVGVALTVENRAPSAVGTIPTQTLSTNDPPITVDVAAYFSNPNNTTLIYIAVSDNTAVVLTQMSGSELTLTPVGAGNTTVSVAGSDGALTATQTLSVSVVAVPTENEAPMAIGVIPVQPLTLDGASSTVDISAYFSDANRDTLTYAAWSDDKNVVGLQREGTLLTITAKAAGSATVTVRARDPEGLQAFQRIAVFVSTTEVPVTDVPAKAWMSDANLRAAVRNALGLGPNDPLTLQAIQRLTSLRYLGPDLSANQKIADLTGLEYALNLEHLDLYMHLISDLHLLERLAKLRSLWLAGNRIANIRPLTSLPLEELDLGGNPITDFTPLAELTGLTRLDFWGNGLGNSDLSIIIGLTQLTQLDLRNNQISDITPITKLVNLKKLQLEGNPISDTSPLRDLLRQNPDLEIDIEISDEPPSQPDTEIGAEVPDLIVESVRVNKTTVDPGAVFRLDAVIRNQGKAISGAATVHFYHSPDETITAEDSKVRTSDLPKVAVDATRNRWARLTAPNKQGVYYYGVCIDNVENEGDTENNCSTAVKITVGTVGVKPPVVGTPPATDPETGEDPPQADLLAKQVFQKHGRILRRRDVKEVLPEVLTTLKEPDIQALLIPATIDRVIVDPDLLKTIVPTISDKFITLMKTDTAIKTLLSDPQVQTLLQTPAAIDELAKLLGISVAPPPAANTHWMPDANLRRAVRKALGLKPSDALTRQSMGKLTRLDVQLSTKPVQRDQIPVKDEIKYITGLEHATQLTELVLSFHQISDLTPLKNLTDLTKLSIWGCEVSDLTPLKNLTDLTYLGLSYNQISDLTPLKNLTALRTLFLEFNQISDITSLKNLTALTGLALGYNEVNDLTPLNTLTVLWWLNLESNKVSDITPLKNLTTLRSLGIGSNQTRDITPLTGLKNLENLSLFNMEINDNYFASLVPLLTSMTNLRKLGLGFNQISNARLLTGLTRLRDLDIRYNQISDVRPLEGFVNLEVLDIKGNPIADLAPLRRLKAKNPNIKIDIDLNTGAAPSAPVLPEETALLSNYPNPFNPETWIPYQLAAPADVTLTIYDLRGVVVRRLVLGHRPAGFYQNRGRAVHWDGRNEIGEKVATGLYFYTFTAGDFTATKKLLIRK